MVTLLSTLDRIPSDVLYVGVFILKNDVHALLFTADGTPTVQKFHAVLSPEPCRRWEYEQAPHDIFSSTRLSAAVQLADLHGLSTCELDRLLRPIPMSTPSTEPEGTTFTCVVWFREAVRVLDRAGVVDVPDVDALQIELLGMARAAHAGVKSGTAPPAHGRSRFFKA